MQKKEKKVLTNNFYEDKQLKKSKCLQCSENNRLAGKLMGKGSSFYFKFYLVLWKTTGPEGRQITKLICTVAGPANLPFAISTAL
jgi:hypothetical protein